MKSNSIRLGISAGLLILLFTSISNFRDVWSSIWRIDMRYVGLGLVLTAADRWLMAYKWARLVRSMGHELPMLNALIIYCNATLAGSILPVTVGGDVVRAVQTSRFGVTAEHVVASIVVERVIGFLACLLWGLASLIFLHSTHHISRHFEPLLIAGVCAFSLSALLMMLILSRHARPAVSALIPDTLHKTRLGRRFDRLLSAFVDIGEARSVLSSFTLLTLAEQLLPVIVALSLAKGLGLEVPPLWLFSVLTIAALAARMPVSIDGLGVYEALFAGLLTLTGVNPADSIAIALTARVLQLLACAPWTVAYLCSPRRGRSTSGSSRGSSGSENEVHATHPAEETCSDLRTSER